MKFYIKKYFLYCITLFLWAITNPSYGGFGNKAGPFDNEDNTNSSTNDNGTSNNNGDGGFGTSTFGLSGHGDEVQGNPPPPPPTPIDGGASILLAGGIGVGLIRKFRNKTCINVS